MGTNDEEIAIGRRAFGLLLPVGGAAGLAGLLGCARGANAASEAIGTTASALEGDTDAGSVALAPAVESVDDPTGVTEVDANGCFPSGALLWVNSVHSHFVLDRASTSTPDGVLAIAANGGGNWLRWPQGDQTGRIAMTSGQGLSLTQGGTIDSPTPESVLLVQPRDPSKQPFGTWVFASGSSFGPTRDVFMHVGYNANPTALAVGGEPACAWSVEQDFEIQPGEHQMEAHLQYWAAGGAANYRPLSTSFKRAGSDVGAVVFASNFNDPNANNVGNWSVAEDTSGHVYISLNALTAPGPGYESFIDLSPPGQSPTSGSVRLGSGNALGIRFHSIGHTHDISGVWVDTLDQLNLGDNSFCSAVVMEAKASGTVYPYIGGVQTFIASQTLFQITVPTKLCSLTTSQVTKSSAYTINSGASPDRTIWIDSSGGSFPLTLPPPSQGAEFNIVDSGNSLGTSNVTLTRHANENINGSNCDLVLATSGAAYLVTCDGTNWRVNKMVMGG